MKITGPQITDFPLYVSEGGFKSLWQKYLVYNDRLVLKTLLRTIAIPFNEVEKTEIHPPNIKLIFKGVWFSKQFTPAIKLDLADLYEHLALYKKSGVIRIVLFTPENARIFKEYLDRAVERFHRNNR